MRSSECLRVEFPHQDAICTGVSLLCSKSWLHCDEIAFSQHQFTAVPHIFGLGNLYICWRSYCIDLAAQLVPTTVRHRSHRCACSWGCHEAASSENWKHWQKRMLDHTHSYGQYTKHIQTFSTAMNLLWPLRILPERSWKKVHTLGQTTESLAGLLLKVGSSCFATLQQVIQYAFELEPSW